MTRHITSKVYRFWEGEEFEVLLPVNDCDFDRLTFDGSLLRDTWKPVAVKRVKTNENGKILLASDFPGGSLGDLIVSSHARALIGSVLEQYGELLPLTCDEGDFWTLNVTSLVDALDEAMSEILRAPTSDRLLMVYKHAFRPEKLRNVMLFKLPQLKRSTVFVTDEFVNLIRSKDLVGLRFKQIWAPD